MSISDIHRTDESDIDLIARTRAGDVDAFAILHTRHVGSAQALARRMSRSGTDADDLVSEGFARVLSALQRGKGPDLAFRPYLLSTIRRLAYDRTSREQREAPTAADDEPEVVLPVGDPVVDGFERDTAAAAFASLPERWRMVLWHTEVEGQSPAEVGELLGMNPNAVAALAYRAREGLRQAYLTEHAPKTSTTKECELTQSRLGPYVRGGLTPAREARLRTHLDECDDCQAAYLELASVNTAMPAIVVFAVLGPVGGGYLASVLGIGAGTATGLATGAAALTGAGAGAAGGGATSGSGAAAATTAARIAARGRYLAASAGVAAAVVVVVVAAVLAARRDDPGAPAAAAPVTTTEARTEVDGISTQRPADPTTTTTPATSAPAPTATTAPPSAAPANSPAATPAARPATTTTAPATTTSAPPEPSALSVDVSGAGVLVRGRPGVVLVSVTNDGAGTGTDTGLELALTGATLRGLPQTPAGTRAPGPATRTTGDGAWACTSSSTTTLRCTNPSVAAGSTSSLFVPVAVPATATAVRVHVSATADDDLGELGSSPTVTLPVDPTGMAARFATVDRGAVASVGNTLLTCNPTAPACASTLAGGPGSLDNGSFTMVPVDVDTDAATTNSSAADLSLTPGAEVLSATLYWSADLGGGPGGSPAPDPADRARAVLTGPDGARSPVVAERVDDTEDDERYQAIADVTAQVRAAGSGRWTFGDAQISTGVNVYAGWSLVVVYRDATLPSRSLVVLDGFAAVNASSTVSFTIGGFVVPSSGATGALLDVVTYEGDLGLIGDQLTVNDVALVDAANPLGNSFNSSASDRGNPRPGRTPSWTNLLGLDLDRFDVSRVLAPGSTSTTITFSTDADRYLTGAVAVSIDQ